MSKIALLIVYNHRYDKNIPVLEKLYEGRFDHVFHIIPFYDGDKENVIPVYESSWYFSGYISQAYSHIRKQGFTHYFIVADDMILNPEITQENIFVKMGLKEDECFLDYLHIMQELDWRWHQMRAMQYRVKQRGVEISGILPDKETAKAQLAKYGIPYTAISVKPYLRNFDFFHNHFPYSYIENNIFFNIFQYKKKMLSHLFYFCFIVGNKITSLIVLGN